MQKLCFLLASSILLSACATSYQSSGITGGYYQIPGPGKLDKVIFSGNGFIKPDSVQDYALYRAAEIAKSKNKPYFILYRTLVHAAKDVPAYSPLVGWMDGKPVAYSFVLYLDEFQTGAFTTATVLTDLAKVVRPAPVVAGREQ
ncbi:CC0125/CC1285 family lipoprotein [Undibacterium sp. Ji42W]|uniref:CC0125/CC1285 family lipoprotein n=1 Tax=Undibacterium sp. Ji42W TaxID=3413039 RepID=UPI003BF047C9